MAWQNSAAGDGSAYYVRSGNVITACIDVTITTMGTGTAKLILRGLPELVADIPAAMRFDDKTSWASLSSHAVLSIFGDYGVGRYAGEITAYLK